MKAYLHLAEGFEEIEAITIVDILRRANIDIEVVSVTRRKEVHGAHGIFVIADKLFEEIDYNMGDMIILPGGMPGTQNLVEHSGLTEQIRKYFNNDKWLCAICAAPMVFGVLGILNEREATCYPGFERKLKGANVLEEPVVQSGRIITSRGPGTAIEFSLKIVEVIKGVDEVNKLKKGMLVCCS